MSSIWDDPALASGDYIKFETVGDKVAGTIQAIGLHTWDDGKVDPKLTILEDGETEPRVLTAGQARLKAELARLRPNVGDRIAIVFTSVEKRAGGKTLKHFDVNVGPGRSPTAAAPSAADLV